MLDAHQLNVFLTAAETLNFTEAARILNMTQPSVSQHIQTLEQHFQTQLFVRAGRQLSLTEAGRALTPMARQMVHLSVCIDEMMESLQGEIHGQLHVGCSTTSGKYVLPFLLAHFLHQHPKVQATCQVNSRRQAIEVLGEGRVHIALSSPEELVGRDVEYYHLFADPILLLAPTAHPWARRGEIEPEELVDGTFLMREQGSGTREVVEAGLRQLELEPEQLNTILTLGNSEAVALAVQEGLGVGFVSQFVARHLVQGVCPVKVCGLNIYQDVYIAQNTRIRPTRAQTAFWDFLTDSQNPILGKLVQNGTRNLACTSRHTDDISDIDPVIGAQVVQAGYRLFRRI